MNRLREQIADTFDVFPVELNRIIATAPHRYKVFYIPKKQAGRFREIAQPAYELKKIQNWLVDHLNDRLPTHDCAVAYRKGRGIKYNAIQHAGKRYVLKMDLINFFPSIVQDDVIKHIKKYCNNEFSASEIEDICKIVLWSPKDKSKRCLCIGAPSSPFISNSLFYDLDEAIYRFCHDRNVTYTRYADDLVFSTNSKNILKEIESFVFHVLKKASYPKLLVNKSKTIHTSKGRGISVTGVVLTPNGNLSIGRERKRMIRVSIHYFLNQKLSYEEIQKLNGLLAFSQDIDPEFILNMKKKYGNNILKRIRSYLAQHQPATKLMGSE